MEAVEVNCDVIAKKIFERGLSVPAVFFLELYKPLMTIYGASVLVLNPLLKLVFGGEVPSDLIDYFQERSNIEQLICKIEDLNHSKNK